MQQRKIKFSFGFSFSVREDKWSTSEFGMRGQYSLFSESGKDVRKRNQVVR